MAGEQVDLVGLLMRLIGSGGIGTTDKSGNQEGYDVDVANKEGTMYGKQDNLLGSLLFGGMPGAFDPKTFDDVVTHEDIEGYQSDPMTKYLQLSEKSDLGQVGRAIQDGSSPDEVRDKMIEVGRLDGSDADAVSAAMEQYTQIWTDMNVYDDWAETAEKGEDGVPLRRREVREKSAIAQQYADAGLANPTEQFQLNDFGNVDQTGGAYADAQAQTDTLAQEMADLKTQIEGKQLVNYQRGQAEAKYRADEAAKPTVHYSDTSTAGRLGHDGKKDGGVSGQMQSDGASRQAQRTIASFKQDDLSKLLDQMSAKRAEHSTARNASANSRHADMTERARARGRMKASDRAGMTPYLASVLTQLQGMRNGR